MLKQIQMQIESSEPIGYNTGSLMQGVLMELVASEYANYLHMSRIQPYSQYIVAEKSMPVKWVVSTLDGESERKLMAPLIERIESGKPFVLKHKKTVFSVCEYKIKSAEYREFITDNYINAKTTRLNKLKILTPCAFKSAQKYKYMPEVHFIFQSLMNKFDAYSKEVSVYDAEALAHIENYVSINRYNIRSAAYHLESVRIPSFLGWVQLHTAGKQTMQQLINLLLAFGEYSGIGIKTAMGMGGVINET